jgi:hypothetical protein
VWITVFGFEVLITAFLTVMSFALLLLQLIKKDREKTKNIFKRNIYDIFFIKTWLIFNVKIGQIHAFVKTIVKNLTNKEWKG